MKKILILLTVTCAALFGCQTKPNRPAKINHVVFFSLQDSGDTQELIEDCDHKLQAISGVVSYWCGEHGDFGRDLVDGDYDVGFYVGFNSTADYEYYLKHPNHIALVQKWKPRWSSIRIHDVVDETP